MTTYQRKQDNAKELPDIIIDPSTKRKYRRGKFLGKGGFARCYELTDMSTNCIYAGKIVPKSLLVKDHQKDKMSQEIRIHKSLTHQHIVGFHGNFEDKENVYIVLELCRRRSLMELHKRRKAVLETEARYFMKHILMGVKHLHDQKIIHRDLKLGNLFLNDEMELKIGDFGLATIYDGERKKTMCGTPNYIAPEIICKTGHGFEVDIWSIGCILYTLLVGKPPFETQTLKETYSKIKTNTYQIPSRVNPEARKLIESLLHPDPFKRPNVQQVLASEFMTMRSIPVRLPTSCLTTTPRDINATVMDRKPLIEINNVKGSSPKPLKNGEFKKGDNNENFVNEPEDCYLNDLLSQVVKVLSTKPELKGSNEDEAEDPAAVPMIWVSKWVDYSDKYGLGYQLSDDSMGVFFNDFTKILLLADQKSMHYIERNGKEHYHDLQRHPETLYKKVTLLRYFRNYMNEHLLKAGASMVPREGDEFMRIPSLRTYFRTRSAIILHLTNGTLQLNFFEDHTKIILCPLMGAITYIDEKRNFKTYRLSALAEHGCNESIVQRLRYARQMISKLMNMGIGVSDTGSSNRSSNVKKSTIEHIKANPNLQLKTLLK